MKKEILLETKLSWLRDLSNQDYIIHPDIDGILSMSFLQNYANMKQVVGIYDLDAFYMKDFKYLTKGSLRNLCAIDLDISFYGVKSIGHHMTCFPSSKKSLNINEYMNLTKTPSDIVNNYISKYPLNTVILLYSIFDIEPKNDEEIALIVYADSVFENYKKYKNNVTKWLKKLNQNKILDVLNNRFENIMEIIDTKIAPITNEFTSSKEYSQCLLTSKKRLYGKNTYKYNGNPKKLLNLIRDITKWNVIDLPEDLNQIKVLNNTKVVLSDNPKDINTIKKNLEKLDKFLRENYRYIVSSSMTYRNEYKITISLPNTIIRLVDNEYKFIKLR